MSKGTKVSVRGGALIGRRGSPVPTAAAQRSSRRWRVVWPGHVSDSMLTNRVCLLTVCLTDRLAPGGGSSRGPFTKCL